MKKNLNEIYISLSKMETMDSKKLLKSDD